MEIRVVVAEDVPQILTIYEPFIRNEITTFETEVPSLEDFRARIISHLDLFPWLVAVEGDKVQGYAYASPHRSRCSYQWSCETSIYLAEGSRGQGIGVKLYEKLFAILKDQGVVNLFAGAALPNEASVAFHKKFGFKEIGTFKRVGFKMGKWIDTYWMQLQVSDSPDEPHAPIPFKNIIHDYK